MYENCQSLTSINFNMPNLGGATNMFYNCKGITSVGTDVSFPKLFTTYNMFAYSNIVNYT
jgi:hypothetical protein